MSVKLLNPKELSLCACVTLALMSLVVIAPVHAVIGKDWDVKQASGPGCHVAVEVDGWYDTEDGYSGYFKTEHIATRWYYSPVIPFGYLYMFYDSNKYNRTAWTFGDTIDKTPNFDGTVLFARTRGFSQFKNTETNDYYQVWTNWALIWRFSD